MRVNDSFGTKTQMFLKYITTIITKTKYERTAHPITYFSHKMTLFRSTTLYVNACVTKISVLEIENKFWATLATPTMVSYNVFQIQNWTKNIIFLHLYQNMNEGESKVEMGNGGTSDHVALVDW